MQSLDLVQRLDMGRIDELLRRLVAKAARDEGPRAFVRLTCGAHQHEGVPVKIQTLSGEDHLALYQLDGGLRGHEALVILPLRTITSITLLNMRDHMDILCRKGPWTVNVQNAPTALQVRRRWLSLVDAVSCSDQVLHLELSPRHAAEPAVNVLLMKLIEHLQPAVEGLMATDEGKAAWLGLRTVTLQFLDAAGLLVNRDHGELRIVVGYEVDDAAWALLPRLVDDALGADAGPGPAPTIPPFPPVSL